MSEWYDLCACIIAYWMGRVMVWDIAPSPARSMLFSVLAFVRSEIPSCHVDVWYIEDYFLHSDARSRAGFKEEVLCRMSNIVGVLRGLEVRGNE